MSEQINYLLAEMRKLREDNAVRSVELYWSCQRLARSVRLGWAIQDRLRRKHVLRLYDPDK